MPQTAIPAPGSEKLLYQGPIIDTHIHLFDPGRPEGIPWPEKSSPIHRSTLPADYFEQALSLDVTGAIAVEASPWPRDNDWLLETCRKHRGMLGFVGNLFPEDQNFSAALERFGVEPLFLGIRYGNLWGRNLGRATSSPRFVGGIRQLAESGRVLDSANPDADLLRALLLLSDQVPELRIVIDHLPNASIAPDREARFLKDLAELAARETVSIKLSEVPRTIDGEACLSLSAYLEWLEQLWGLFGAERVMFGSDWPNSALIAPLAEITRLSLEYLAGKSIEEQALVLYGNSRRIYRWQLR
jgi:L-fuconolactonase